MGEILDSLYGAVLYVDIAPPANVLGLLASVPWAVVDHHVSAQELLQGFPQTIVDESYAGSMWLAHILRDLYPAQMDSLMGFVSLVDSYDRWQQVSIYTDIVRHVFERGGTEALGLLMQEYKIHRQGVFELPWVVALHTQQVHDEARIVREGVSRARYTVDEFGVPIVITLATEMMSQIGAVLYENDAIEYVVMLDPMKGRASYRSRGYPVNVVAERHGGGGHPMSAGSPATDQL